MTTIEKTKAGLLLTCIDTFSRDYLLWLQGALNALALSKPDAIEKCLSCGDRTRKQLSTHTHDSGTNKDVCKVDDDLLPFLKRCLVHYRRKTATELEERIANTTDSKLLERLGWELSKLDVCNADPWYLATRPAKTPEFSDFFTLQFAEYIVKKYPPPGPRRIPGNRSPAAVKAGAAERAVAL